MPIGLTADALDLRECHGVVLPVVHTDSIEDLASQIAVFFGHQFRELHPLLCGEVVSVRHFAGDLVGHGNIDGRC